MLKTSVDGRQLAKSLRKSNSRVSPIESQEENSRRQGGSLMRKGVLMRFQGDWAIIVVDGMEMARPGRESAVALPFPM